MKIGLVLAISVLVWFAAGVPSESARRIPVPTPATPIEQVSIRFINKTAANVRTELTSAPTFNAISRSKPPETRWVHAFRNAHFVTGRTNEILVLAVFQNGVQVAQKSFGPFSEKVERIIKWNGKALVLEERKNRPGV